MRAMRDAAYELRPRGMAAARARIQQAAVSLGWTPPGWRAANDEGPRTARVLERLGDLAYALAALRREPSA